MEKSWVISIRNQCRKANVPFVFKQWGGIRKSETGRSLDGKTYDEFPRRVRKPILSLEQSNAAIESIEALCSIGIPR
jgi:hypothetical protein